MIDKVAICGLRRANSLVPMQEIQQAIGRAGRSYTKSGEVVIVCEPEDYEYAQKCLEEASPPISSNLVGIDAIAFHVLPWIARINDEDSFNQWFQKSLAFQQGAKVAWNEVKAYLVQMKCVDDDCNLLDFGRISTKMYFSPKRINLIAEKLQEAYYNGNLTEPEAMSWVLAHERVPMDNVEALDLANYKQAMQAAGYWFEHGELIQGFAYFCILTAHRPKWIKSVVAQLMDDIGRLLNTVAQVSAVLQLPVVDDIQAIATSVCQKVPVEIARLMTELGIEKKQYAYELFNMDICCRDDFQYRMGYIEKYGTDELKKELVRLGIIDDLAILHSIGHFKQT